MQALPASFLRILDANHNPVGAGFLVSDRLALTCAHVVAEALGQKDCPQEAPDTEIELDFPLLGPGKVIRARTVFWEPQRADGRGDVAGLELTAEPVTGAKPVRLVTADKLWGHACRALGFPRGYEMGYYADGELRDIVSAGWLQFINPKPTGRFIQRGFSGGPVWDDTLQGVVGMIVASDQIDTAFCIPTEVLVSSWPVLGEQAIPPCPYRGLFAFREQDAPFFFGRESFVRRLQDAVQRKTLVALVGPSGSGKSSAVFAGLVPLLRADPEWRIASFRPGVHPIEALATELMPLLEPHRTETEQLVEAHKLAEALHQGQARFSGVIQRIIKNQRVSRLLLVVDQFEELYTACPDPGLRQRFLDGLLESADQAKEVSIVMTIRGDFMGRALAYGHFADALQNAIQVMGPMTADELRQTIEKPAGKMGIALQDGLVKRILDDVGMEAGKLPLLEFALTELWERQSSGKLTHEAYDAIKGVEGALADYADQVFAHLDTEGQKQVRRVLVRLVSPGAGTGDTRRVATRGELGEQPWELVKRLADFRLVVTDQTPDKENETVEIVHEALIHQWGKFQEWLSTDREFLVWRRRLGVDLEQWKNSQQDVGALLYELSLAEAEEWLKKRADDLEAEEKEFIQASINRRNRMRAARERGRNLTLAIILTVAFIAAFFAVFSFNQSGQIKKQAAAVGTEAARAMSAEASWRQEASRRATAEVAARGEADRAERAEVLTRAQLLVAQGRLEFEDNPLLGLRLAIEGLALVPDGEAAPRNISDTIREFSRDGRIMKLGYDIQKIYSSPDESILVSDRGTEPGELRRLSDLKLIDVLTFEVKDIAFGTGDAAKYFLVRYSKIYPPELRLISNGEIVPLSGEIENIYFGPGNSAAYFVVDYVDLPGELRRVSDAGVFSKLPHPLNNQVIFSKDPACPHFVLQYIDPIPPTLNRVDNGAAVTNLDPGPVEGFYCSPDPMARYFLVDYAEEQKGELYRLDESGGVKSEILNDAVESVSFSPDPAAPYFWLDYKNAPGELRLTSSGEVALSNIDAVFFPADSSTSHFVVNPKGGNSELWSVSQGELITETLAGIVEHVYFFTETLTTTAILDYVNASGAIRQMSGSEVPLLKGEVNWVYSSPGTLYKLVAYQSAAGEIGHGTDLKPVETKPRLSKRVESGSIVSTSFATYFWIHYPDKQSEIWHAGDNFVRLAVLDFPVKDYMFIKSSDRLIVISSDQQAYLLDVKWLRNMAGDVDSMPLDELVHLVCTGPLASGLLDMPKLETYLDGGQPQACR